MLNVPKQYIYECCFMKEDCLARPLSVDARSSVGAWGEPAGSETVRHALKVRAVHTAAVQAKHLAACLLLLADLEGVSLGRQRVPCQ